MNQNWTNNPNYKHWKSNTKLYRIYSAILKRCNSVTSVPFKWYWWRWIKCEWNDYQSFENDMLPNYKEWLQIDRINNNWNYSKENCRWVTSMENNNNRRWNHKITYNWETLWISEWSRKTWIPRTTIMNRIKRWWETKYLFINNTNNGKKIKHHMNT